MGKNGSREAWEYTVEALNGSMVRVIYFCTREQLEEYRNRDVELGRECSPVIPYIYEPPPP
jgi:hypothetical protein